jgi:hypothetical protein
LNLLLKKQPTRGTSIQTPVESGLRAAEASRSASGQIAMISYEQRVIEFSESHRQRATDCHSGLPNNSIEETAT